MDFIIKNIWFILFLAWGLPLSFYRSKFRKNGKINRLKAILSLLKSVG